MNREVMPSGTNSQTTAYVYGTTSTSGVFSNDLLAKTEYPDPSTGLASTSAANDESYTYNALGQKTSYTDRNGTTHVYDDDVLGRLISDVIPTGDLGAGVSNQTLALGYTYNNAGLPFQQTSYSDSAMTTVENQVEDLYNGLGQMIEQYQETSGAVNTGTSASVQWRYSFGSNHSQLAAMTYPNGRIEDYGYNAGIDATISRISTIADDGGSDAGTVAAYTYLGLSTIVQEAEPQINTELTYINQSGDAYAITDGGDRYTGLDRFGRVDDQWYLNTSTSATVDRLQYGYDRDGNVLYQNNLVNGSFSELYHANSATTGDNNSAYDPLSRLTAFRRGTLTSSGNNGTGLDTITTANLNSTTGVPTTNQWNYDALGNWTSSVPNGTSTSNTFNSQNEETANGSSTLVYDHNGDMTTDQLGNLFTYDAWGHVIRIASSSNSTEETFSYDALGRAVVNNNGSGTEDRYYSGPNIIQEQFSSTDYAQYVYGLAYVDDVILRDRNADGNNSTGNLGITGSGLEEREYAQHDTQFSTISLTDSTGAVMQRFIYDPYGAITVLTPTWTVDGTGGGTNYWLYTFQGMRIVDAPGTSGMLFSETRIYDAALGRWISQDPAGYADATNLYQLEHAAPADFLDSSGLGLFTPGPGPGGFGGPPIGDPYWSQRPLLGGQTPGAAYLYGRPNKTEGTGLSHITTTALAFHVCGCKAGSAQKLADSLRDSLYSDLSTFKSYNAGNNTSVSLVDPEYPAFTVGGFTGYLSVVPDDRPFHVWFQQDPSTFTNTAYTLPGHPLSGVRKWWVEEAPDPTRKGCITVYVLTQAFEQARGPLNWVGNYLGGLSAQSSTWDTYFANLGSTYGSGPGVTSWGQSPTLGKYVTLPNPWWPY